MKEANARPTVTLRLATIEDAAALAAIYAPYVADTTVTFEYEAPDATEFARRIAEFSAAYPYVCAVVDGRIAGYAYAHRRGARKAYDWAAEASVYIDRAFCRQGIGHMLYRALFSLLTMQNVQSVYAFVAIPNPASVSFHNALGFTPVGTSHKTGFKLGRWLDTQTFELALGEYENPPAPVIPFQALDPSAIAKVLQQSVK